MRARSFISRSRNSLEIAFLSLENVPRKKGAHKTGEKECFQCDLFKQLEKPKVPNIAQQKKDGLTIANFGSESQIIWNLVFTVWKFQSLRFYVKSILGIVHRRAKSAIKKM